MLHYELSLRKSSTLFNIPDVEIATRAVSFINFIDKLPISSYLASDIIALDETAVYIGIPQQSTIERRGKSTVSIQSTGFEGHRVSCVLGIRGDGTKLLPLVIMKGSRNVLCEKNGVLSFETEKAWSTQEVLRKYICRVLPMLSRGNR